jgi:hypothetical protein
MGHTMAIHSQNEQVILEFGLKKPAFRVVVNTPTTHGSVGLSTGLDPAMTLGCGGYGGNITSDNISPRHLLNIKRLAYELTPTVSRWERVAGGEASGSRAPAGPSYRLPGAPPSPAAPAGISADALTRRIDQFLSSRGYGGRKGDGGGADPGRTRDGGAVQAQSSLGQVPIRFQSDSDQSPIGVKSESSQSPMDFVCEEDVRLAIRSGKKLVISERAIITPAARELAEQHRVFTVAPWRG